MKIVVCGLAPQSIRLLVTCRLWMLGIIPVGMRQQWGSQSKKRIHSRMCLLQLRLLNQRHQRQSEIACDKTKWQLIFLTKKNTSFIPLNIRYGFRIDEPNLDEMRDRLATFSVQWPHYRWIRWVPRRIRRRSRLNNRTMRLVRPETYLHPVSRVNTINCLSKTIFCERNISWFDNAITPDGINVLGTFKWGQG
jgi:hypothetical protein